MSLCMTPEELCEIGCITMSAAEATVKIRLAQEIAENHMRRKICLLDHQETRIDPGGVFLLSAFPIESIASVTVDGFEINDYVLHRDTGVMTFQSKKSGEVCVSYRGGFASGDVPETIKHAIAMIVLAFGAALENQGQKVVSERLDGYSIGYAQSAASAPALETLSPVAAALLKPYCAKAW